MCDQDNSYFTDKPSSVKPQNNQEFINPINELSLINQGLELSNLLMERKEPMPYIPRSGQWWLNHWASFWGETPEAIKRKFKKINYVPLKFGDTLMIDAAEFWVCLNNQDKEAE